MNLKNLAVLAMTVVSLSNCGIFRKKGPNVEPRLENSKIESELISAQKALEEQRYAEAAEEFDKLLVSNPASEFDLVILFNSGSSYEGMGDCRVAIDRYRKVLAAAAKFKKIEAQALHRLSLMYECLGQDTKAIATLLETKKKKNYLAPEIVEAEIPARIAAAYARLGNHKMALKYFSEASRGLKATVNRGVRSVNKELVAKTMFMMGQLNPAQRRGEANPESFLQSLSMQQPYLLQASEIGNPIWSQRAAEELRLAYDLIWRYDIANPLERRKFMTRGLQTAAELRKIRYPESTGVVQQIFAQVDETETRLRRELAKVAEETRLTAEAEKREGLKREGRVVNPEAPVPPVQKPQRSIKKP